MFPGARASRSSDVFPNFHVFVVHDYGSQSVGQRSRDFGRRIGDSVSDVGEETADIAVLHQTRYAVSDVVEETWGRS